jgi:hypothetical protein
MPDVSPETETGRKNEYLTIRDADVIKIQSFVKRDGPNGQELHLTTTDFARAKITRTDDPTIRGLSLVVLNYEKGEHGNRTMSLSLMGPLNKGAINVPHGSAEGFLIQMYSVSSLDEARQLLGRTPVWT